MRVGKEEGGGKEEGRGGKKKGEGRKGGGRGRKGGGRGRGEEGKREGEGGGDCGSILLLLIVLLFTSGCHANSPGLKIKM